MSKYLTEFIGTFFLVLTICLMSVRGTDLTALAVGAVLTAMVYMGGHISGAHYNPAISVAFLLRGKFPARDLVPYWVAQIAGALAAAGVALVIADQPYNPPAPAADASVMAAIGTEILFTFALALVILNVATTKATEGNAFYGLAIGLTVAAGAFAGGPISGGVFNPAVGIGPILVDVIDGGNSAGHLWMYLVGPLVGAALAVGAYSMQHGGLTGD